VIRFWSSFEALEMLFHPPFVGSASAVFRSQYSESEPFYEQRSIRILTPEF
jgi:hypothetical protein